MRKMNNEELKDFFQEGIVGDLMVATRHYLIFRTIGENYAELIKSSNKNHDKIFGELQSSSADLAVLSLAKIFDARHGKYIVRSINELLSIDFTKNPYFPLYSKDYIEFSIFKSRLKIKGSPDVFENPVDLALYFKNIFLQRELVDKINKVKYLRDKFLAHNEHNAGYSHLEDFWTDFSYLIDLMKVFVSLFGVTIISSHYFQFEEFKEGSIHYSIIHQNYWLVEELEEIIGKEKFNYWWRN
jgi:hypothetical protein